MRRLATLPIRLTPIEQRFLRGPSLWSGNNCLVSVVEMGPLARALTTDVPGLADQVLSLFPGMHDAEEALRRGCFIAEVLGRVALELLHAAGEPPHPGCALIVHARQAQVKIVIDVRTEQLAVQAFEQAAAIVLALCVDARSLQPARSAKPARPASSQETPQFIYAHAGEHGQHEHQRLLAAAQ
jgi:hypothetical protein